MKKRKVKRYDEGGFLADFEREPLRDSSGNIVTDSSGEPIMSGSSPGRSKSMDTPDMRSIRMKTDRAATMSGIEDTEAEEGRAARAMLNTIRQPAQPVRSEYDAQSGLDYAPGMGSKKPMASTKPPVKPAAVKPVVNPVVKPAVSSGRGAPGMTAEQFEEGRRKFAEDEGKRNLKRLQETDKPLERINPEASLMGGPALRGLKALGAGLAGKMAARDAPALAGLLGRSKNVGETLSKDMGPVQYAAGRRSMLQNQRGEGVITPKAPPREVKPRNVDPGARRPTRDELDIERMGSDYMRKGGRVKASSGSMSSASKRADGIAMRGKTRGKYI